MEELYFDYTFFEDDGCWGFEFIVPYKLDTKTRTLVERLLEESGFEFQDENGGTIDGSIVGNVWIKVIEKREGEGA